MPIRAISDPEPVVSGHATLEGPAFDRAGNLFFVDWERHGIFRLTPEGEVTEWFNTGGIPAGLAFHPDGSLWVADEGDQIHGLLRITPDQQATIVVNEYEGTPLNGANDLVFDRAGTAYFSDPWGTSADNPTGGFYRYFADGRLEKLDDGLAFPNGVALCVNENYVYLAETYRNRILRYAIAADGTLGPREHWADTRLPSGPDGMALAADGSLLVAHYGGGSVDIFDQSGKEIGQIAIPGAGVTNVAFGGPDNSTIFVTECATGTLYRVEVSGAGFPLNDGR